MSARRDQLQRPGPARPSAEPRIALAGLLGVALPPILSVGFWAYLVFTVAGGPRTIAGYHYFAILAGAGPPLASLLVARRCRLDWRATGVVVLGCLVALAFLYLLFLTYTTVIHCSGCPDFSRGARPPT